jgi:hypothetical protein
MWQLTEDVVEPILTPRLVLTPQTQNEPNDLLVDVIAEPLSNHPDMDSKNCLK